MAYNSRNKKLLLEFADASDQLLNIGVISTDSFTGEIGEFYGCKAYKLQKSSRVNKGFDGICKLGNRYQIKAKIYKGTFNYTISKLKPDYFEYLLVIFFDRNYVPKKIIRIPQSKIPTEKFRVSNSNIESFESFDLTKLKISESITAKISHFAALYNALIEQKIIRSRKIVGDIGEFYAADRLNLKLEERKNAKGLDATDDKGNTYEIKTRRVYDSDRRVSNTRRINGLIGKSAKYLIVVTLDRNFLCSGMWIMPTKNIVDPKSAKLQIVNSTPGVKNLIPSNISYLRSGEPFNGLVQKKPEIKKKRNTTSNITPAKSANKGRVRKTLSQEKEKEEEIFFTENEKLAAFLITAFLVLLVLIYSLK